MGEEKKKKNTEQTCSVKCEKECENSCECEKENPLAEELEKTKALAEEYKDKWMRNVAEFDNYKKRNAKIWQDAFDEGVSNVVLKLLPIGDNLDWALTLGLDEKTAEGIVNLKKKYNETLSSIGLEEIDPLGQIFDPNVAEAVMQVEGDENEPSDTVKQVFQKGYKIKDKIIRYAKVSVVK